MATPERDRFDELYRDHRGAVYRFLLRDLRNREDAEDATQTAFLQAYSAYERGSRPERPRAWLLTIADNLRKRRFRSDREGGRVALEEAVLEAPAEDERIEGLRDALETLPFNQRAALVLREVGGLSYAEIARQLDVSLNAVQMLIFRARRNVREQLDAATRSVGALAPSWLAQLLPAAERLPVLRAGGAAAVAAVAALAVTGAESGFPTPAVERHRPVAAADAAPEATSPAGSRMRPGAAPNALPPRVSRPAVGRAAVAPPVPSSSTRVGAPVGIARATPTAVETRPQSPAPAPPVVPSSPLVPEPSLVTEPPLVPEPPVTAAVDVPPPPLPLPPLPQLPSPPPLPAPAPGELEGVLEPQIDAVLAGR